MKATFNVPGGIKTLTQSPEISKYYNDYGTVYNDITEVNSELPIGIRYIGLTVNVNKEEYWYKNSIDDGDLVLKQTGGSQSVSGSGIINRIPVWNSINGLTNSVISDIGSILIDRSIDGDASYLILKGVSDGDNFGALEIAAANNSSRWQFASKSNKDFEFVHNDGTSWTTPFTIKNDGNVLIGVTDSTIDKLQVNGTIIASDYIKSNKGIYFGSLLQQSLYNNTNDISVIQNNNQLYSILEIKAPEGDPSTLDREATISLTRADDNGAEFLDLYNNGYSSNKQYGIRIQKRGIGEYRDFVIEYSTGISDITTVLRLNIDQITFSKPTIVNATMSATNIVKIGGLSTEVLMADGSVSTLDDIVGETQDLQSVLDEGNTSSTGLNIESGDQALVLAPQSIYIGVETLGVVTHSELTNQHLIFSSDSGYYKTLHPGTASTANFFFPEKNGDYTLATLDEFANYVDLNSNQIIGGEKTFTTTLNIDGNFANFTSNGNYIAIDDGAGNVSNMGPGTMQVSQNGFGSISLQTETGIRFSNEGAGKTAYLNYNSSMPDSTIALTLPATDGTLALLSDIPTGGSQDLQSVLDEGSSATKFSSVSDIMAGTTDGDLYNQFRITDISGAESYLFMNRNNAVLGTSNPNESKAASVEFADSLVSLYQFSGSFVSSLKFDNLSSSCAFLLPAKAVDGTYTLATTSDLTLDKILANDNTAPGIINLDAGESGSTQYSAQGISSLAPTSWGGGSNYLELANRAETGTAVYKFYGYNPAGTYTIATVENLNTVNYSGTTTGHTSVELSTLYPAAKVGDRVQAILVTGGALVYEKSSTGWIKYSVTVVP
jgi:hypothetical protein